MRGKTLAEVAEFSEQQMRTAAQPAPAPAPAPVATPEPPAPDPNLFYENPQEYQRQLVQYQNFHTNRAIEQASAPFLEGQVEMAEQASRGNPDYADVWGEYGVEIKAEVAKLPLQHRANPRAWNTAAELIAGRHRRELTQREIERARAQRPDAGTIMTDGTMPPGAAGDGHALDPISQLFADDDPSIQRHKANGLNASRVKAQADAMGHTYEKYAEMLKRKATVHA